MCSASLCINFFITSLRLKDDDVCFVARCFHERLQIVWPGVVVRQRPKCCFAFVPEFICTGCFNSD